MTALLLLLRSSSRKLTSAAAAAAASGRRRLLLSSAAGLAVPDPSLVDASQAPADYDHSAVVYSNFIQPHESDALVEDLRGKLKRRRYEKGHWDAVIVQYKETELWEDEGLSDTSLGVLERVRSQLLERHNPATRTFLPCHAIDLHVDGQLNAHVDSVRFSGHLVAGLSLLSPSIMRLLRATDENVPGTNDDDDEIKQHTQVATVDDYHVDLYLPPLSLYVLSGDSRYKYSHELLPDGSIFHGKDGSEIQVARDHRLSVIFRDAKAAQDGDSNNS